MRDQAKAFGRFVAVYRDPNGNELWRKEFDNLLTQTGKALLLDQALAGVSYTAVEYMGLISSAGFTSISAGDTPSSHSGWLEAGNANGPTYSGTRKTAAWSAATVSGGPGFTATKALSAGLVFTFTGSGSVQGAFFVGGSGAVATIDNTSGILYAAGSFGSALPVSTSFTLTVSYSSTLA